MTKSRTDKRSRSGAAAECPLCTKKLRGVRGLKMHIADQHPDVLEPHTYHPSVAHMGDCSICGNRATDPIHGDPEARRVVLL